MRCALHIAAALLAAAVLCTGASLYVPDRSRAALEAEYAQPPSTFLDIAGIRLHVRDTGPRNAPAIIFLHGFASSLLTWEDWAQALQGEYRVIRYDLPGFGLTGADPRGDYSDQRSVAVLLALMDRLGVARAEIVGHSMGGRIAWTLAAAHPERVDRLVLIAPDGFATPPFGYGQPPAVPLLARVLPYVLPNVLLHAALAAGFAEPDRLSNALFIRYRDMLTAPGVRPAILARMQHQVLLPPAPMLARIHAPTLLLWGERDAMEPFANAFAYRQALPNAKLVPLADVGHIPQEEAPARSLAAVEAFLHAPPTTSLASQ